jgi:hypothetical protein
VSRSLARITALSRTTADRAVEILALAFAQDPLVRFLLSAVREPAAFNRQIRAFFRFSCGVRFELDWPLLGCVDEGGLQGVTCVSEPVEKPWPDSLTSIYQEFTAPRD